MSRITLFGAMLVIGVTSTALADQLPGTLNFSNVTDGRIVQTVGEMASNEKEVDFGDFDNDGDLDIVIATAHSDFGQRRNKLYRNDDGVFNEISGNPVIPGFSGTDVSRNAFFRDYDLDGWLDIIIVNDNNTGGDPGRTKIYINQHPGGVFSHYTEEGLVRLGNGTGGAACGGVSIDADLDGDWDLYVGNYPGPSQDTMYFNQNKNPGFFTDMTGSHVPGDNDYTVDVSSADMNGDGTLDLLISNTNSGKLYYNNKSGAGSGNGDYSYGGSVYALGSPGLGENSMEPGDFDNDGDQDFYWSNKIGSADRVLQNTGNDANNNAIFVMTGNLPPAVTGSVSRKATVADLNDDGRLDIYVGTDFGRPTILRNTTVDNVISFIDWTPAPAFPNGSAHRGWHAAIFDSNGDGDLDILLGGWSNEHLFENVPSNEMTEDEVDGNLPPLFNLDPIALVGTADVGETDAYTASDIGSNSFISVVVNGDDDYLLEVLDGGNNVVGTSDRGGLGTEEALQVQTSAGSYTIQVTTLDLARTVDTDPDDWNTFRGFITSGDLNSLLGSDDDKMCHNPGITIFPAEAPITLDFVGVLSNDSPASLEVTIESTANTVGLELTFSFWNFNTNSWDIVGTATQSLNTDTVRSFPGTPADHVESGTGEVRTRYEVRVVSFIFLFPCEDCVDQVFWTTPSSGEYVLEVLSRTGP